MKFIDEGVFMFINMSNGNDDSLMMNLSGLSLESQLECSKFKLFVESLIRETRDKDELIEELKNLAISCFQQKQVTIHTSNQLLKGDMVNIQSLVDELGELRDS